MDKIILAILAGVFIGLWVGLRTLEEYWRISRFLALAEEESDNVRARNSAE